MRLEDLNWMDVEQYLKVDNRLIFVIGACEQHGYLSLTSDVRIPMALGDAASQKTGVLLAPPVPYGISPYFSSYPGSFSLRLTTLVDIIEDLVRSAYGQGFNRLLFLNGHGGNDPVRTRLFELVNEMQSLQLAWYSWWQSHSVESVAIRHGLKSYHAGWIEAFEFNLVSDLPPGEKTPPHIAGILNSTKARSLYGDGVFGGPYQVDKVILDEVFSEALLDVVQLLSFTE